MLSIFPSITLLMGYSMLTFWVSFVFLTLWGSSTFFSFKGGLSHWYRAMIVTFDIGARFSFLWRVLYLLFFLVNICRTEKNSKREGGGGGGQYQQYGGGSPLMGPVACWFMGLFELWLGVLLYVINNWERGPCTATNWQKVAVESVRIARNKGLAGGNDWRRIAAARMMPKQVIGMPQETGLNLFLRSHQENTTKKCPSSWNRARAKAKKEAEKEKGWRTKRIRQQTLLHFDSVS